MYNTDLIYFRLSQSTVIKKSNVTCIEHLTTFLYKYHVMQIAKVFQGGIVLSKNPRAKCILMPLCILMSYRLILYDNQSIEGLTCCRGYYVLADVMFHAHSYTCNKFYPDSIMLDSA